MRRLSAVFCLLLLLLLIGPWYPTQAEGQRDQVTAWLYPGISESQAVVEVWAHNAQPLRALGFPFKFVANDSVKLDSIDFDRGRIRFFSTKIPNYDPATNTLLVNIFNRSRDTTLAGRSTPLPTGEGEIFRMFLTAPKGKFPHDSFDMAPIIIPPENRMIFVTDSIKAVYPAYELKTGTPPSPDKNGKKKGKKDQTHG